jgi:hypothetical protein
MHIFVYLCNTKKAPVSSNIIGVGVGIGIGIGIGPNPKTENHKPFPKPLYGVDWFLYFEPRRPQRPQRKTFWLI